MSYLLYWRYLKAAMGSNHLPEKALERERSKARRSSAGEEGRARMQQQAVKWWKEWEGGQDSPLSSGRCWMSRELHRWAGARPPHLNCQAGRLNFTLTTKSRGRLWSDSVPRKTCWLHSSQRPSHILIRPLVLQWGLRTAQPALPVRNVDSGPPKPTNMSLPTRSPGDWFAWWCCGQLKAGLHGILGSECLPDQCCSFILWLKVELNEQELPWFWGVGVWGLRVAQGKCSLEGCCPCNVGTAHPCLPPEAFLSQGICT